MKSQKSQKLPFMVARIRVLNTYSNMKFPALSMSAMEKGNFDDSYLDYDLPCLFITIFLGVSILPHQRVCKNGVLVESK